MADEIDRISDLPGNVMDQILTKLPIKDIVRTSILSRKWRYMWNSAPLLRFDVNFFDNHKSSPYDPIIIINQLLLLHNGTLHGFKLRIPADYKISVGCLSTWILFLSRRAIKHLLIVNNGSDLFQVPSHIFSCKDLKELIIDNFELSVPASFHGFTCLLQLHLFVVKVDTKALESLLLGCPCLEKLTLNGCYGFECINVSGPRLEELSIAQIWNVKSICVKNVKNLIDLTLIYDGRLEESFERYRVSDLIEGSPKLEKLFLGGNYIKILSTESVPQTLKGSIDSLKCLKLDGVHFNEAQDLASIICLLEISPNLVELFIKCESKASELRTSYLKEIEGNSCCLSRLKTVNITVETASGRALALTRFLLANATSLETLKFERVQPCAPDDTLFIAQELLQMERASQRAKVAFL